MTTDNTPASDEILGLECKHVSYTKANDGSLHDMLAIKEVVHYKDGRKEPRLRLKYDYKRPYWITKPFYRNHHDKKEWEDIRKLDRKECLQVELERHIQRSLDPGRPPSNGYTSLRRVCRSPYVYGADITTPTLVKHAYMEKFPEVNGANSSIFSTCHLDTETDVISPAGKGGGEITISSLALYEKVALRIQKRFLAGVDDPINKIRKAFDYYLGDVLQGRKKVELDIQLYDTEGELAYETIQNCHRWQPDWIAIWNMSFDINVLAKALERGGYNVAQVFSDPSVPPLFWNYEYHEGSTQKVTQSGKTMPLPPFDQWHSVFTPASFQVLDDMCLYRKLRVAFGLEPGYGLDAVLERNLGMRKLKFKEADHLVSGSLQWHAFMQQFYPVEYCIYNCWDSISKQFLDEKTGDVSRQIGLHSGHSEVSKFPSQPRRTWDDLHFECLKDNLVAATTSDRMRTEMDDMTYDLRGWINVVTLIVF